MLADAADDAPGARRERRAPRRGGVLTFLRDVVVIVLVALLVAFLVKTFLVRAFYIPSASMEDTLMEQDRILVDELTPRFGGYDRGDVVVFRDPGGWLPPSAPAAPANPLAGAVDAVLSVVGLSASDSDDHLIKRIVGLPGDRVACCNDLGQVTINGTPVDESGYLTLPEVGAPASAIPFEVVVPDDALWVMGDNRYRSRDSRYNQDQPGGGFVPLANVVGRAFVITWPFPRFGLIPSASAAFAGVPDPESPSP